ncbi:MAG: capsule biosynthesis protein [Thiotrichales bacterium]
MHIDVCGHLMARNVLFLQGPVGPFFWRLARELRALGHKVFKINLNGGDAFFYSRGAVLDYTGTREQWPTFLESQLRQLAIERIYLFGDCRQYHVAAKAVAQKLNIAVYVFEEGYLRPDYITLEAGGVNGNSDIPKVASHYRKAERVKQAAAMLNKRLRFVRVAVYAMIYYIASVLQSRKFPYYEHHRPLNVFSEGSKWIVSGWRKLKYAVIEKYRFQEFFRQQQMPYFLVPLQVHTDMQVIAHSPYKDITDFIHYVLTSFAQHAGGEQAIVFKHHPLDRGYRDYTSYLARLEKELHLEGRVIYVHDCHLPTLLKHCRGVVTINSTVGLSALHHGKPVKVMGNAIYNIPGLAARSELDDFWTVPEKVDKEMYKGFRAWLLRNNQVGGSFYWRAPGRNTPTGLTWPDKLAEQHGLIAPNAGKHSIEITT